jgi:hypothetical protein
MAAVPKYHTSTTKNAGMPEEQLAVKLGTETSYVGYEDC